MTIDSTPNNDASNSDLPDTEDFIDSTDAMAWAEAFVAYAKAYPEIATDSATMVAWFAACMNAATSNLA